MTLKEQVENLDRFVFSVEAGVRIPKEWGLVGWVRLQDVLRIFENGVVTACPETEQDGDLAD